MANIVCEICEKKLSKDEVALNKKLISKSTKQFMCITCLAKYLCTTVDALNEKIEEFKEEGCTLFI